MFFITIIFSITKKKKNSANSESGDPFDNTEYREKYIQEKLKYRNDGPLFPNFDEFDRRCSFGVKSFTEAPAVDPIKIPDPVVPAANVFRSPTLMPRRDISLRRKALSLKGISSSPDITFVSFLFYLN